MRVLISPGYGAGWSTWHSPEIAFDTKLIEAFEFGATEEEMKELCEKLGYGDVYMGGYKQLEIRDVEPGSLFRIAEYDGHEYIVYFDDSEWTHAV